MTFLEVVRAMLSTASAFFAGGYSWPLAAVAIGVAVHRLAWHIAPEYRRRGPLPYIARPGGGADATQARLVPLDVLCTVVLAGLLFFGLGALR